MRPTVRVGVLATALGVLLAGTVVAAAARERAALPRAVAELRSASEASGEVKSCLQGAQDELGGGVTRISVAAARAALELCDLRPLETIVRRITLPPAPPLSDSLHRRARADIEQALPVLQRMILDAHAARHAMAADLGTGAQGAAVVLSYRSFEAGDRKASGLAFDAYALVEEDRR